MAKSLLDFYGQQPGTSSARAPSSKPRSLVGAYQPLPPGRVPETPLPQAPTAEPPGLLSDTANLAKMGIGQLGQGAGYLTGIESLEQAGAGLAERAQQALSPAQQQAMQNEFVTHSDEEGYGIGPALTETPFRSLFGALVSSLPATAAGMGVGGLATKGLAAAGSAMAARSGAAAGNLLAKPGINATGQAVMRPTAVSGAVGFGAGEGVVSAGIAGSDVKDFVRTADQALLDQAPGYQALIAQGLDPATARETLAEELASNAALGSGAIVGLLGAPMGAVFGRWMGGAGPQTMRGAVLGGAAGEAAQEAGQSAGEEYIGGTQRARIDPTEAPTLASMANQAVGGALAGGVMGGAFGAYQGRRLGEADAGRLPETAAEPVEQRSLASPQRRAMDRAGQVTFPDGSTTSDPAVVDAYVADRVAQYPQDQQAEVERNLRARLYQGKAKPPAGERGTETVRRAAVPGTTPRLRGNVDRPGVPVGEPTVPERKRQQAEKRPTERLEQQAQRLLTVDREKGLSDSARETLDAVASVLLERPDADPQVRALVERYGQPATEPAAGSPPAGRRAGARPSLVEAYQPLQADTTGTAPEDTTGRLVPDQPESTAADQATPQPLPDQAGQALAGQNRRPEPPTDQRPASARSEPSSRTPEVSAPAQRQDTADTNRPSTSPAVETPEPPAGTPQPALGTPEPTSPPAAPSGQAAPDTLQPEPSEPDRPSQPPAGEDAGSIAPPGGLAFTPTHEAPDGTPLRATAEPGVYEDAEGVEIEEANATPITTTGAPTDEETQGQAAPVLTGTDIAERYNVTAQSSEDKARSYGRGRYGKEPFTVIERDGRFYAVPEGAQHDQPVHTDTEGDTEPATSASVTEAVQDAAKATQQPTVKIRKQLLDEVEQWAKSVEKGTVTESLESGMGRRDGDFVRFKVPGDGTFKVRNTPENLRSFADRVKKVPEMAGRTSPSQKGAQPGPITGALQEMRESNNPDDVENAVEILRLQGKSKDSEALAERLPGIREFWQDRARDERGRMIPIKGDVVVGRPQAGRSTIQTDVTGKVFRRGRKDYVSFHIPGKPGEEGNQHQFPLDQGDWRVVGDQGRQRAEAAPTAKAERSAARRKPAKAEPQAVAPKAVKAKPAKAEQAPEAEADQDLKSWKLKRNSQSTTGKVRNYRVTLTDPNGKQYNVTPAFPKEEQPSTTEIKRAAFELVRRDTRKAKTETRYSRATTERDAEYLAAVERGDMDTAQRMVTEAAREAGYTVEGWHGRSGEWAFTVFDTGKEGGAHFGTLPQAEMRGKNARKFYLRMDDPARLRDRGQFKKIPRGRDSAVYLNRFEGISLDTVESIPADVLDRMSDAQFRRRVPEAADSSVVRNAWQIKSAEAVTRDDNGAIIPLSQRFDPRSEDTRFARGQQSRNTAAAVRTELGLNRRAERALLDSGLVSIVQSASEIPGSHPSDVAGAYHQGKVYLVADNIPAGRAKGLLGHELGIHHGLKAMVGEAQYAQIVETLKRQVRAGSLPGASRAAREAFQAHVRASADSTVTNPDVLWQETIAYLSEAGSNAPVLRRIMAAVRAFLRRLGLASDFTAADMAHLARGSIQRLVEGMEAQGQPAGRRSATMYHRVFHGAITDTPAFTAWFGNSKLTNPDGSPRVFYHVPSADFTAFDKATQQRPGAGFFFSTTPDNANRLAGRRPEGANVMPVYLKADKPLNPAELSKQDEAKIRAAYKRDYRAFRQPKRADYPSDSLYERAKDTFDARWKTIDSLTDSFIAKVKGGQYGFMENTDTQRVIQAAGFDAYFLKEGDFTNVAVYEPTQIKSAVGNTAFDPTNPDIRFSRSGFSEREKAFMRYMRARVFKDAADARNQLARTINKWEEPDFRGVAEQFAPDFIDRIPLVKHGKGLKISTAGTAKLPALVFGEDPIGRAPDVAWGARDLQDYRKTAKANEVVEQVYIPLESIPKAKLAGGATAFDWREMEKGGAIPPVTVRVNRNGRLSIVDGNHRIQFFRDQGYDSIGAYVIHPADRPVTIQAETRYSRAADTTDRAALGRSLLARNRGDVAAAQQEAKALYPGMAEDINDWIEQNRDRWQESDTGTMYSRAIPERDYTDEQKAALAKINPESPATWTRRKLTEALENWQYKLRQGTIDQFDKLLRNDRAAYGQAVVDTDTAKSAWVLARMSKAAEGALQAMIYHGRLFMDNGAINVDENEKSLMAVFDPLQGEVSDFLAWVAGNRAERLKTEDRERLFDDTDIQAMKALNQGQLPDGQDRNAVYRSVQREFQQLQKSVLDIAESSGLINTDDRAAWEHDFYVPFYRVIEDDAGDVKTRGLSIRSGLVKQKAFEHLKGGRESLNDLLTNTLMNWNHLLGASLRNQAADRALDTAQKLGIATRLKSAEKGSVYVMRDGQPVHYQVDDPLTLEAITALDWQGMRNPAMRLISSAKRLLTRTVTITPAFQTASLMRDSIHSIAVTKLGANPMANVARGWKQFDINRGKMLAGGGAFQFGARLEGDTKALQRHLEKQVKGDFRLADTPNKVWQGLKDALHAWDAFANRIENINRSALYQQLRDQGHDHLYASFQARDLMDFSQTGAWASARFLTMAVPFLNARLQGLDKLGRAGLDPKQRVKFALTIGAVMAASSLLYLLNSDDERYRELEEWQRDTYWWFFAGDLVIAIPKPFEVGALGTLAERALEQAVDAGADGTLFLKRLKHVLLETFSFNPTPQLVAPLLDLYANRDPFRDRPIESMSLQNLSPTRRATTGTSEFAKGVSRLLNPALETATNSSLSPVQVDYLITGYFGWVGQQALKVSDLAAKPALGLPSAHRDWLYDTPLTGDMARRFLPDLDRNAYTRSLTAFYEDLQKKEQLWADFRTHREQGDVNAARGILEKEPGLQMWLTHARRVQRRLSDIRKQTERVQRDGRLSAAERERRIRNLNQQRKDTARAFMSVQG